MRDTDDSAELHSLGPITVAVKPLADGEVPWPFPEPQTSTFNPWPYLIRVFLSFKVASTPTTALASQVAVWPFPQPCRSRMKPRSRCSALERLERLVPPLSERSTLPQSKGILALRRAPVSCPRRRHGRGGCGRPSVQVKPCLSLWPSKA